MRGVSSLLFVCLCLGGAPIALTAVSAPSVSSNSSAHVLEYEAASAHDEIVWLYRAWEHAVVSATQVEREWVVLTPAGNSAAHGLAVELVDGILAHVDGGGLGPDADTWWS